MLAKNFRILAALPVFMLLVQGCTNTEGNYNDFVAREKALQEGGAGGGGGFTPCDPPKPGDIDAQYLYTLSAKLGTALQPPVIFLADVKTTSFQGGTGLKLTLHSLSATDRKTEVGTPLDIPVIAIGSDGVLDPTPMPKMTVTGEANALQPGHDIVASDVTLIGQMCGVQDFYCGTVTGNVTQPITLDLKGSPYTFQKVDPSSLPPDPIYVNCAKDTAPPPP